MCNGIKCVYCRAAYAHVILGAHHLYNNQNQPNYMTMKTMKFINHPDYDSEHIANDVALVELPIEVEYNGNTINQFS